MIKLDKVSKTYHMGKVEVPALRDVSLSVDKGEMVALIGSSGSGKSTLMNIIGCLDNPTSGQYLLDGSDVSRLNDNQLAVIRNKKFGFVFQDFNLLTRMPAVGNVELPLVYSGIRGKHQLALEALEKVNLGGRARHRPTELSGGEQQRVAIARALVNKPELILADEPTGNLDSAVTEEIINLFGQLNAEGITIILVTHEMDIAERAKRIILLKDGEVISDEKHTPRNGALNKSKGMKREIS
ncbi:MAG: ABC transporter ATP-binding protein [Chloroflexota bacterium]